MSSECHYGSCIPHLALVSWSRGDEDARERQKSASSDAGWRNCSYCGGEVEIAMCSQFDMESLCLGTLLAVRTRKILLVSNMARMLLGQEVHRYGVRVIAGGGVRVDPR